ncbi:MAG: S9 family peptidase, partial [Rhodospirillaceae bacterium]|nr:S9 family peptidase [Rhodospirillaceae bacterium]
INIRGLWRRTTLADYVSGDPDWEVILDLDALAEAEGENWVWKGASCLRPDYRLCALYLSRGGADATVIREFDMADNAFVEDGFVVPEAKSRLSWIDENTVFIGTDFGDGSLTDSGYPRTARIWNRGEPISDAIEVFAGERADVSAGVYRSWDGDAHYDVAVRSPTFYTSMSYLVTDARELQHIDIPEDASFRGVFNGQMLVGLKSDWTVGGETYLQGSLIAADFENFLQGERNFDVLYVPTQNSALPDGGVMSTRDYLVLNTLEDVVSRMFRYELTDGEWAREEIGTEAFGSIRLVAASDTSNALFFSYENFLTPDTLYFSADGGATTEALQSLPQFFDADGMSIEQRFATSPDGTSIPYFLMLPAGFEPNGNTPTLLYGYGGFEISLTPG